MHRHTRTRAQTCARMHIHRHTLLLWHHHSVPVLTGKGLFSNDLAMFAHKLCYWCILKCELRVKACFMCHEFNFAVSYRRLLFIPWGLSMSRLSILPVSSHFCMYLCGYSFMSCCWDICTNGWYQLGFNDSIMINVKTSESVVYLVVVNT